MAGFLPHPRAAVQRASWPRELHRAALLLGLSGALFWSSFAIGRWIVSVPPFGVIYLDLLLAWIALLIHVVAWPNLWNGLRDLRARRPNEVSTVVAWRAFLSTLVLVGSAVFLLPLQYHTIASTQAWILVLYVTSFPYLAWFLVPVLALHGIVFGRVANYLDPRSRRLADAGALVLFAVAVATTAVVLQNPGATAFVRSWGVGRGLLPAAALAGYGLIALGMTVHVAPVAARAPTWTPQRAR